MALSSTTRVGFSFQSAFTTGALVITASVPVDPPTFTQIFDYINDQGVRGDPVLDYDVYQGVKRVEASIDGPFYAIESGYFLKALMGSETFATGTGVVPSSHTFFGAAQPAPVTFFVLDDVSASAVPNTSHTYYGMYCSSFGLRANASEGILTFTSTWTGAARSITAAAFPAYGSLQAVGKTLQPFLGWTGTAVLSGAGFPPFAARILDFEITINRPTSLLYSFRNNQVANRGDAGPIECTGRLTIDYSAMEDFSGYDNNSETSLSLYLSNNGATNTAQSLEIIIPKIHYTDAPAEVQRGDVSLALSLGFRGVGNAADKSPVRFLLRNVYPAYV